MLQQLLAINWGELFTAATIASASVVALVTQLLKYIPQQWTTKYAVYINVALSIVAAIIVHGSFVFTNWIAFVVQVVVIALSAALGYELLIKGAVTNPKGNNPATLNNSTNQITQ